MERDYRQAVGNKVGANDEAGATVWLYYDLKLEHHYYMHYNA